MAHDRVFHDRQIDDGGGDAEENRQPPDVSIGAGRFEHHAAEPDAEEAADRDHDRVQARRGSRQDLEEWQYPGAERHTAGALDECAAVHRHPFP